MTTIPAGTTSSLSLLRKSIGLGSLQIRLAANTIPNCPRSEGSEQASPTLKLTLLLSCEEKKLQLKMSMSLAPKYPESVLKLEF